MARSSGLYGPYWWKHLIIWMFIAFSLFPVIWVASASIDPTNSLVSQRIIPRDPTLANYRTVFTSTQHPIRRWMLNSIKVSGITALLVTSMSSLAAYAFSRFRFRGRRTGLFATLLIQIFPQMSAMVAIYLLFLRTGKLYPPIGLGTHAALILSYLGGAMGVNAWLIKGYFDTIPKSLEESAAIDGASPFVSFYRIIVPLSAPVLAVVFLLQFIASYSEYVIARILLTKNDSLTLTVGLQTFIDAQYAERWGIFSAAAVVGALPIMVLFVFLQRYIVSGLSQGAVKE